MVPAEGIEPPTFGLQNHCSTAELSRRNGTDLRARIADLARQDQNPKAESQRPEGPHRSSHLYRPDREKAARRPPFAVSAWPELLAGMPEAVAAAEPGAGGADKAVLPGIFLA